MNVTIREKCYENVYVECKYFLPESYLINLRQSLPSALLPFILFLSERDLDKEYLHRIPMS